MRRSPRPTTGRAAHPDRAVLAASFAEDVVLDLQCCEDSSSAVQPQGSISTTSSTSSSTSSGTTRGASGVLCAGEGSPKAAPRSKHNTPTPKPRSGTAGDGNREGREGELTELIRGIIGWFRVLDTFTV